MKTADLQSCQTEALSYYEKAGIILTEEKSMYRSSGFRPWADK